MNQKLCLAAVVLFVVSAFVCAEDAPTAPVAAPTPPAAPAPGDAKSPPSEKAPGAEAPVKPAAAQAIPTYPLKTENFKDIEDDYNDSEGASNLEPRAFQDIIAALHATPYAYVKEHVNPAITYVTMMNKPESCRGELVKLSGTLRYIVESQPDPPLEGVTKYWKGQISVGAKYITTFISLEPLPADVQIGRAINVQGIFMKRYVYANRAPGNEGTWTPLVIVSKVERAVDFEQPASAWMNSPYGIALFLFVGIGMAAYLWMRKNAGGKYPNRFSRMKEDKHGPAGNFPRPNSSPKKEATK